MKLEKSGRFTNLSRGLILIVNTAGVCDQTHKRPMLKYDYILVIVSNTYSAIYIYINSTFCHVLVTSFECLLWVPQ